MYCPLVFFSFFFWGVVADDLRGIAPLFDPRLIAAFKRKKGAFICLLLFGGFLYAVSFIGEHSTMTTLHCTILHCTTLHLERPFHF